VGAKKRFTQGAVIDRVLSLTRH